MALEPAGLTWVNENLGGFIRGIGEANSAMASTGEAAERAGGGFNVLEGVVMGVASSFTTFALDAVTKFGQAIVGLGTSSVDVAAQFQTMGVNLAYAGAQFKDAADAVGGFDEIALKVGGDTRLVGVSATGAADAMTGLLKSGLSLTDVMGDTNAYMKKGAELGGALRASIDLAAASELDMVQASDLAVVAMSTFNISAEDITGAMDYMVRTADASVAEVSDLQQALVNVGPSAAAMGLSFEDVNIALGILSERGIKGAEAGTALKSMLTNVQRPTKAVQEALAELNLSLYDSQGVMKPMGQIIEEFSAALGENATMTVNTGGASEELAKASEKAKEAIPGLTTKISEQEAALTILQVELGNTIAKYGEGSIQAQKKRLAVTKLTNDIAESTAKYSDYVGVVGQYDDAVASAGTAVVKLTDEQRMQYIQTIAGTYGMNAMNTLLGEGVEGWDAMATAIGGATSMSAKATAQSQTYAGQMEALNGVVETLKIRVGTALLPALTSVIGIFSDMISRHGPALTAIFERVGKVLGDFFGGLSEAIAGGWPEVQKYLFDWAKKFWDWVTGPGGAVETGSGIFTTVANTISKWLVENWPAISDKLSEWGLLFWDWVSKVAIPKASEKLLEISNTISQWLVDNWPAISAKLSEWAERFWDWINEIVVPAAKEKLKIVSQAIEDWSESPETQASLSAIGESVGSGLVEGVQLLISAVETWTPIMVELAGALTEAAFKSIFPAMRAVGKGIVGGIAEGIAGSLGVEIPEAVKESISEIGLLAGGPAGGLFFFQEQIENVGKSWQALSKLFGKEGEKIEKDVPKPFEKATKAVTGQFETMRNDIVGHSIIPEMMNSIERIVVSSMGSIQKIWSNAWSRMQQELRNAWGGIESAIRSGISSILSILSGAMRDFGQKGREIAANIASGISAAWGSVVSAVSDGMKSLSSAINSILGVMVQAGRSIASSIASGISAAWNTVYSTLASLAVGLQNAVFGVGSLIAAKIVNGISQSLAFFWGGVSSALAGLASGLATAVDWAKSVAGAGAKIVDGIIDGVVANWQRFVNWLKSAIAGIFGASEPTDVDSPFHSIRFFETGLRIGDAITKGIQTSLSQGLIALPATSYAAPPVAGRTANVSIGPIMLGSQMDGEVFAQRVKQVIVGAF